MMATLTPALPRNGVTLRFWVEPLGPHTQYQPTVDGDQRIRREHGRQDLVDCLPGFRWALIFPENGEIQGFKNAVAFKAYCADRFGVTKWRRDWTGDWTPENGAAWISDKGQLWDLERGPVSG